MSAPRVTLRLRELLVCLIADAPDGTGLVTVVFFLQKFAAQRKEVNAVNISCFQEKKVDCEKLEPPNITQTQLKMASSL